MSRPGGLAARPWQRLRSRYHNVGPWRLHSRVDTTQAPSDASWAVLVHGLGISGRYLAPLALALAPRFRVAVPDLPGHGRTNDPGRLLGVSGLARALRCWLDATGIERPHLVANSLGCQVVLELAGEARIDLRSLVLVGPTMDPTAATVSQQLVRLLRGAVHEPWPLLALAVAELLHRPARGIRELRSGLDHNVKAVASMVTVPTIMVRGARDRVAPRRWLEELAGLMSHACVVDLPVGAHAVHVSHPHEVSSLVGRPSR